MKNSDREELLAKLAKYESDLQYASSITLQPLKYRVTILEVAHCYLLTCAMDASTKTNKFLVPEEKKKSIEYRMAVQSIFRLIDVLKLVLDSELYCKSNNPHLDETIYQLSMLVAETIVGITLKQTAEDPNKFRLSKHLETFGRKTKIYFEQDIELPEYIAETIKIKTNVSHHPVRLKLSELKTLYDSANKSPEDFFSSLDLPDFQSYARLTI